MRPRRIGGKLSATANWPRLQRAVPPPAMESLTLKDPGDFRLIGTSVRGVDTEKIVEGQPIFGIDVDIPGMRYAVYEKSPIYGSKIVDANVDAIRALPGVRDAFVIRGDANPNKEGMAMNLTDGVAIVADSWWVASKALDQLEIEWEENATAEQSTAGWAEAAAALAGKTPTATVREGRRHRCGACGCRNCRLGIVRLSIPLNMRRSSR